uniref:Myxalamid-type polyketide synthase MxaB n=1 Tax=Candidatus Kentrum sp. TUN TaxID=2126343 RepID=A0A450ZJQ9_9GAMM|nr:MAG: myxalamid-type polyketide synthase MxaB [Candidatus Kentron sp. TUN]
MSNRRDNNVEPVAIIGMGCRFPGDAENLQAFWNMLCEGRDGVVEVPPDRWDPRRFYDPDPNKPAKTYVKHGAYLRQPIDQMDALFFGISPREAESLDPQQRILLEVVWEALEDAGLTAEQLAGSATGIFMGGFIIDHIGFSSNFLNRHLLNTYSAVGFTHTILSARIAYILDLHGPCLTMDTACSSSLVALHQACQSIRALESELALVGGVNVMHRAETPTAMCKSQFLARDGRSKSFDARGDGYGRGEGAGVVVLKPLAAARRDGDEIYAIIHGTGINHDGRTDGITVPNEKAQAALIRQVCERSGISPGDIAYFEAHGTGTFVGDPKECTALGEVIGQKRNPNDACWIGGVKANIGHLEAAAGVAGVIKTALCLYHRQIPPVANLETPNPRIDFEKLGLRLPRKLEPMPENKGANKEPPLAGINSFGYGGTNAHAILQGVEIAAPLREASTPADHHGYWFLPVSARSDQALQDLAGRYHGFLKENREIRLRDICWSAATRRTHHHFRLAVLGKDRDALLEQLALFAQGKGGHLPNGRLAPGQVPEKPVFVFTGMGPQWWAMGRELLATEPVYREMAEHCDAIFRKIAGWSILEEMGRDEKDSRITQTHIAQPANFVLQIALVALWKSKGITPAAIVGHSVGEVSASYAAGTLSLIDAMTVSFHRSRLQRTVAGQGRMLAVGLNEEEAEALLDKYGRDKISFGAVNSPTSLTLSGDGDTLEKVAEELKAKEVFNRFLQVELAYHSPIMDGLREGMLTSLADLKPLSPDIPLYSTVTGKLVDGPMHDAAYWCNNIRQPVRFGKAIESMIEERHGLFLEVGPHPVLGNAIKENTSAFRAKAQVAFSLKRKEPEIDTFYRALGNLYTLGCLPDWSIYPQGSQSRNGRFVRLPHYPWQRQTYWLESEESRFDRLGDPHDHPLLGHRINAPEMVWEQPVNSQFLPWLPEHKIQDLIVLPGAAYVEIGLSLFDQVADEQLAGCVEDLRLEQALVITSGNEPLLRTEYDPKHQIYSIYSRNVGDHAWTLHARGHLSLLSTSAPKPIDVSRIRRYCPEPIDISILYKRFEQRGMQYGEAFRGIREITRGHQEVLARIAAGSGGDEASAKNDVRGEKSNWRLHPTQLDAAFQSLLGILDEGDNSSLIPVAIGQLRLHAPPARECWVHGRLTRREGHNVSVDIDLFDDDGTISVEVRDLHLRELDATGPQVEDLVDWIYRVDWEELPPLTERQFAGRWLLFMDRGERMAPLAARLEAQGIAITRAFPGEKFAPLDEGRFTLRSQHPEDMRALAETIGLVEYQGVVYGWGMDCDESQDSDGSQAVIDGMYCSHIVYDAHNDGNNRIRFFLLTQNAQSLGDALSDTPLNVAQASLIGLGRVISAEHYYYTRCCLIDLPTDIEPVIDALVAELLCEGVELEIALRGAGQRLGYRLQRCALEDLQGPKDPADNQPLMLNGRDAFELERQPDREEDPSWQWREVERKPAKRGQVAIHVEYAILPTGGLHHYDKTLIAVSGRRMVGDTPGSAMMGLLPITQLASYLSLSAGAFIEALPQAGGLGASRFRRFLHRISRFLTRRRQTAPIPDAARHAASLLPFVGAIHAIEQATALARGERVLIHPSDDGMDFAAVQVARNLGAKVFVIYTDEAKAKALRALKADEVLPLEGFADAVLELTDGKGVQVVLNTLDGEPARKSLFLLTPFGRFVNFNKTFNQWHVLSDHHNIAFHALDTRQLLEQEPVLFQELLNRAATGLDQGIFQPLDVSVFEAGQVGEAMETARDRSVALEIGAAETLEALPLKKQERIIRAEGSYLVTGGFGGFGITLAFWLAAQGAKSLVLVGRRGAATPEAQYALKGLEAKGVSVWAAAADVGKEEDVQRLIRKIQAKHPPLIGVFHTAGVVDDALLTDLTPERLRTVMQPKAMGAWYLHRHTLDIPLDYFVLFSSISAFIGKPGQSNYVAANAFLDQLVHARCARGLPGLSLNWGVLAEVGMAARQELGDLLEKYGLDSFTRSEAMEMLNLSLRSKHAQLGLMNVNWQVWLNTNYTPATTSRYQHLYSGMQPEYGGNSVQVLKGELQDMDEAMRVEHLVTLLVGLTAQIMRLPEDTLDSATQLSNLGLDSLMGTELRGNVASNTSVTLSILELQGSNMEQLAEKILEKMGY